MRQYRFRKDGHGFYWTIVTSEGRSRLEKKLGTYFTNIKPKYTGFYRSGLKFKIKFEDKADEAYFIMLNDAGIDI